MALITAKELIENVYRRIAQDVDVAQSSVAASDDNPNYPRSEILAYLNAAQCNFVERLDLDIFRTSETLDLAAGEVEIGESYLSRLQLVAWQDGKPVRRLKPSSEQWLDQNYPQWRDTTRTSDIPTYYVLKQTNGRAVVIFGPAPTGTVSGAIKAYYLARPTEMSADDDAADALALFPQIQRTILVNDVMGNMIDFGASTTADERQQAYKARYELDMGVARRIGKKLALTTDVYTQNAQ